MVIVKEYLHHGYVPFVIVTILSFRLLYLITRFFFTRVTRWRPLVEQKPLTLPEHLSSHTFFSEVHITQSVAFSVVFYRRLFSCPLSFRHCIVPPASAIDYLFGIFKLFLMCYALFTHGTSKINVLAVTNLIIYKRKKCIQ